MISIAAIPDHTSLSLIILTCLQRCTTTLVRSLLTGIVFLFVMILIGVVFGGLILGEGTEHRSEVERKRRTSLLGKESDIRSRGRNRLSFSVIELYIRNVNFW